VGDGVIIRATTTIDRAGIRCDSNRTLATARPKLTDNRLANRPVICVTSGRNEGVTAMARSAHKAVTSKVAVKRCRALRIG
jgi:hypothetical protein